jgi:hypothetical protein
MKLKKVVIDRKSWLRGGRGVSCLLSANGRKCCIGFAACALGAKKSKIKNVCRVSNIVSAIFCNDHLINAAFINKDNPLIRIVDEELSLVREAGWLEIAYDINDDKKITDKERERKLRTLGRQNGIMFVFKN